MATYLLLRSNKESGPYTREQLKQLGLKPYDLVWVEGKSAAWRYPGEVAELKEFAPMVEEQPFDRFYKQIPDKAEKHFHELVEEARKKEKAQPAQAVEMKTEKVLSKVFVSLPGDLSESIAAATEKKQEPLLVAKEKTEPLIVPDQKKEPVVPVEYKKEIETPVTKTEPLIVADQKKEPVIPVEYKKEIETPVVKMKPENEPAKKTELIEEYSQPLSEIKKQYAEIYLNRKQKTANRRSLVKIFQLAGAALFVLALGALIYLTVKPDKPPVFTNDKNLQTKEAKPAETAGQPALPADQTVSNEPVQNNDMENNKEPVAGKTAGNEANKITEEKNNEPGQTETAQKNTPAPVTADPSTGERNKTTRGNTEQIKTKPASLNTLVSVKANEYKRKAFGGIENLQLTVVNSSSFVVDKVIVELQYLKPSELPLKTETIEFNSIAPNGAMTIKIPDNTRGIKVTYKILQVESSQYDKSTAGL